MNEELIAALKIVLELAEENRLENSFNYDEQKAIADEEDKSLNLIQAYITTLETPLDLKQAKYLEAAGLECPNCGSRIVASVGDFDVSDIIAMQPVECKTCKSSWTDEYRLVGFSELEVA